MHPTAEGAAAQRKRALPSPVLEQRQTPSRTTPNLRETATSKGQTVPPLRDTRERLPATLRLSHPAAAAGQVTAVTAVTAGT